MDKNSLVLGSLMLVVVSSGCIDAEASLSMDAVSGTELGEKASVDIVDLHPDFEEVLRQGSFQTTENPPRDVLEHDLPVLYNGSLYTLNRTRIGTEDRIKVGYSAKRVDAQADEINLTDGEEGMVDMLLDQAGVGSNISAMRYYHVYTPEEKNRSVLIQRNETTVVRDDVAVSITKESQENTTEELYNYTGHKVAENLSEYSEKLREEYRFRLNTSNISEEFLQSAIDETYYGDETEEMLKVVEALKQGRPVKEDFYSRTWIVNYRNNTFWTHVRAPSLEKQVEKDDYRSK
jgi:hypothetical protein